MLSIMTLTYIFKVTKFEMWMFRKRWELTKNDFYTRWYLPSNGTIANVVLRGFDPIFQGQIFQMQISLKWLAQHTTYGFYRLWYLQLNGVIHKGVLCDVSQFFQGRIFQMYLGSGASCANMSNTTFMDWYLPSKSNHCQNHTLQPWLAISWSKLQIFSKLFQQICLHLHGTRRRIALVLFKNLSSKLK